ncbi:MULTISPECIES: hypothetical protein [unclassified Nostoc]|uniref:hypothetical protein n=1 Tax=unclassified Nostoc TaxID=2593658 RepID=UPI002AD79B1E|nr:hypothetical protein [Nostoc sp. DedQUE02]
MSIQVAAWIKAGDVQLYGGPKRITKRKSDVVLSNNFLLYLVVAYALVTDELAKHTGQPAIVHRIGYVDQGKQKFHQFSDEELEQFLNEYYPT